jgi:hypothetical protein
MTLIENTFSRILAIISEHVASSDFWQGTAAAVVLAALAASCRRLWAFGIAWFASSNQFSIQGYWTGQCVLPSYAAPQIEIWHYSLAGQSLRLTFYAYDKSHPRPTKWRGSGVFRGAHLACSYYLTGQSTKKTYEAGVMALRLRALKLQGVYAQFDPKVGDEPLYVSQSAGDDQYIQGQIELPVMARLRMRLGLSPFITYQEALSAHNVAMGVVAVKQELPYARSS